MYFIWYIIIGIIAGFVAGKLMRGGGFGLFINLLVGIVGNFVQCGEDTAKCWDALRPSSKSMTSGFMARARAIAIRCC